MVVVTNQKKEAGNKREQILLAAVGVFFEKDYYQATIIEIAERAGVGKGTVYECFPSKEELFKECFSYCAEAYIQSFHQHLSKPSSVKEAMFNIVNTHLELVRDNRTRLHLLFTERPLNFQELQAWVLKQRQELLQGITSLIAKGIEIEEIRSDIDAEMAGRLFLALTYVVIGGLVILDNVEVRDEQITSLFEIYWNGLGSK